MFSKKNKERNSKKNDQQKKENSSVHYQFLSFIFTNLSLVRNDFYLQKLKVCRDVAIHFFIINSYKKVNCNIAFDEKISSGHDNKMGAKDDGKVKTYKILI